VLRLSLVLCACLALAPVPAMAVPALAAGTAPLPARVPDIDTFMQIGAATTPILTRDGTTLYFTTATTGTRQLYRLTPEGWPYQLTFFPSGVSGINLSRDEKRIAVTAAPDGTERYQIYMLDALTGLRTQVVDEPQARLSTPDFGPGDRKIYFSGNPDSPADFYIYEQDLETGVRRIVYRREGLNSLTDITGDGKTLLVAHTTSNTDNDLYLVDVETGSARHLTPHEGGVNFSAAFFVGDARTVYVAADDNPQGVARLAKIEGDPPRRTPLLPEDASPWAVESVTISSDFRTLAWTVNEDGWARLHLWDVAAARELPVPTLDGIVSGLSLSDTGRLAFGFNSPLQTADIWTWDGRTEGATPRQRTFSTYAGIDPGWFTPPELVRYESFDGTRIPAFVYMPPGPRSGPVPFIIDVHGGPEGQFRPYFNRHFQYLLLNGYGIFAPNVRGSTGYGRGYTQADDYRKRLDSVKDMAWGARYLVSSGRAAAGRIGIKGGSYGGYMTLAVMTEFPELVAAGIDEVGIANFESFFGGTAAYRRDLRAAEYGPPSDSLFLRSISPIHKVDRIRGALLVVHGENDPRVPVGEARQIIRALKERGSPVDSLIFPDEGHGVAKLPNRLVYYRKMVEFFDRYLKK
jgi:dipeptidyl aminopeptidase/acylaminoacyl peptidase